MKKALIRIMKKDVKSIIDNKLSDKGIYIEFNEENMLCATAMIIGPKDSVYENGILFFDIDFPPNYPYAPPKITYSANNKIRIHPNLYVNGKVCLSILNTWSGPKWSSVMDIAFVLLTMQSILDNNPLYHEPGYEQSNSKLVKSYNNIVEYNTLNSLIIDRIYNIPEKYIHFIDIINNHLSNIDGYIENKLRNYSDKEDIDYKDFLYRINLRISYSKLKEKFENVKQLVY